MQTKTKIKHLKKRAILPRFFLLLLQLFACALLPGCSQNEPVSNVLPYFDLQHFLNSEMQHLSASKAQLKKTTIFDGLIDSTSISQPDWHKEFALLAQADIKKPAWKNSFTLDSVLQDSTLLLRYTPHEKHIPIRMLEISFVKNQVRTVHAVSVSDNFVYSTTQEMWYRRQKGFRIIGRQKVLWFYEKKYELKTAFIF